MPAPIPIESVNHVSRTSHDLQASIDFYRNVLGFRPVDRPAFGFPGAWLSGCGIMIHLIVRKDIPPAYETIDPKGAHLAFHVADIEGAKRLLKEHGIDYVTTEVKDRNIHQVFFRDPGGYQVELANYPGTPPFID